MARLEGQVAIVTGAARGIGAAYAKALAAAGAKVVAADIRDATGVANAIRQQGGEAIPCRTDVTDDGAVRAMVDEALKAFGRIDILVNNAALFADLEPKPFETIPLAEWDKLMLVNVRGSFQCIVAVTPAMRERRYGKIVNIASGTVFKGIPHMLHYVTSKGAILAMTRALARELGPDGICVNTLAPGLTASEALVGSTHWHEMTDAIIKSRALKREELPEDVTGALVFLASHESDFMTGQCIVVDGGSVTH